MQTFKDLWAETKCDLDDCQAMLKEKENELEGALKFIQKSVSHLADNRAKITKLEADLAGSVNGEMSSMRAKEVSGTLLLSL